MNETDQRTERDDDALLEDIFRHAEPRPRPRGAARARTFATLHAQWQRQTAARRGRRRLLTGGLAAGLLLAVFGGVQWFGGASVESFHVTAGVLRASGGEVVVNGQRLPAADLGGDVMLRPGDRLETSDDSRVALHWDGASLRIDHATSVTVARNGRLQLRQGAVYFDSKPFGSNAGQAPRLVVETALGDIAHVGTQFLAEARDGAVAVSVREGEVRFVGERVDVSVTAGETARLQADGRFDRQPVQAHAERWQWAADIAPEIDLAGRSIGEVLAWIARETGRELRYRNPEARALAAHEPRGIASLAPLPALRTLPYMTSLDYTLTDRYIVVDVATEDSTQ